VTAARTGPLVATSMSCQGCVHEHSESYKVQGDSGSDVSCRHPGANEGTLLRRIGDTTWRTPEWCPLRPASYEELRARIAELEGHLAGKPIDRAAVLNELDVAEASVDAALAGG
jgi:hypothetical protein